MKKLLSLTMAMMMLFSTTAFAETTTIDGVTVDKSMIATTDENKKYDVVFNDSTIVKNGNEYMLWALKGIHENVNSDLFAQGNVLYVNQATAADNQAKFYDFLPMAIENSTLVISGQGMAAPKIVGYIVAGRVLGDLNGDGKVTNLDAEILLKHVLQAEFITDEETLDNADMTGEGNIDMDDVVTLMTEKTE